MIALLVAASVAMLVALFGMPTAIRMLRDRDIGQFIQEEVEDHAHKQGTPTMGGIMIVLATVLAYLVAHISLWTPADGFGFRIEPFRTGGLLALMALVGMALIGFVDDYVKLTRKRSLGLSIRSKFLGQLVIAIAFAVGADAAGVSTQLSFVRPLGLDLGVFFVALVLLMLIGAANGANLADGMDGLAAGSAALMVGAFTIIAFWQSRNDQLYNALDPRELAILSAAMLGGLLGFLWWNAPPASVFMGDVGSNAVGGLLAALALLTNTQLLLIVLAGLYVAETISVMIQVFAYKRFGRRVFRMAPFHHHFEMVGWPETTIVIRLWIVAGVGVALALGFFYADFLRAEGLL